MKHSTKDSNQHSTKDSNHIAQDPGKNHDKSGKSNAKFDFSSTESKEQFWHSSAHLLAHAVIKLFPEAKITIGPPIENGFYYDIDYKRPFTPEDLRAIEKRMYSISKENLSITRKELSASEAKKLFYDNEYKIEMIDELAKNGETITVFSQGDFTDLCRGPHVVSTGVIQAIKLTKVAGAYWRGNAENKQLQRIYGITFPSKEEMADYQKILEEAEKRDHRKIGESMGLFSFHDEGKGFPFWHHKGMVIFNTLMDFLRAKLIELDYQEIKTPIILSKDLWLRSGHWDHYKENMYFTKVDSEDYAIKPMNCPGGILVYKSAYRSYKELPLKLAEFGVDHRHELSGVLHGLTRVRAFTMDDAHVFCTEDQIEEQIQELIKLAKSVYSTFGFSLEIELSTKPENAMGSQELWDKAESALKNALKNAHLEYELNEGDGAFYGPKIDFKIKDALSRRWQLCTIQVDFQMPEKFELKYMGSDGTDAHRPVMIHRAIYGSFERFIALLLEHFAGKLPLWISPVQAKIVCISEKFTPFAESVRKQMKEAGIILFFVMRIVSLGYKVRAAQMEKVNYILVIGDKEEETGCVNVRTRNNEVLGMKKVDELIDDMKKEIADKIIK